MLRTMSEIWGLTLIVGLLGTALGFGIELVTSQPGWSLVGASIGLCGGAMIGAARATPLPRPARQPAATTTPTE